MRIEEVRKAISKALFTKTGLIVHTEHIEIVDKDYLYIELVDFKLTNKGTNRALQQASWQVKYIPVKTVGSQKEKIFGMLQDMDLAFDNFGKKFIKVNDRRITLVDVQMFELDGVGHYLFDTELFVEWGTVKTYELMQNIETGGLNG